MGNSTEKNRAIYLDTFTSALSFENLRIQSIEWVNPTTITHTCTITLGAGTGINIVEWTCRDVGLGDIKYFDSLPFREVNIAISGVQSGSIIIIVR